MKTTFCPLLIPALIALVVLLGNGGCTAKDTNDPHARINFFHAVTNGPDVDIQLRGSRNKTAHTIFKNIEYTDYTEYYNAAGGMYDIIVVAHANHSKVILMESGVILENDVDYTIVITGLLSNLEKYPLRLMTFQDDNNDPDEGKAKLRFIHIAGGFNPLDVTLDGHRLFRRVAYGQHGELIGTGYASVDSDEYTMLVTEQDIGFAKTVIDMDDGDVLTVYAVGIRGSRNEGPDLISQLTSEYSSAIMLSSWFTWLRGE